MAGRERPIREHRVSAVALEAYTRVRRGGWLSDRALNLVLRGHKELGSRERRAASEQVYGLLRRLQTVDAILERLGGIGPDDESADGLRLQVGRVLDGQSPATLLERVELSPEEAAIIKGVPAEAERLESLPALERLELWCSLPTLLARRILAERGDEAMPLAESLNARAPIFARANTLKADRRGLFARLDREGVRVSVTRLSPLGIRLGERLNLFGLESFKDGWFEIQDEGSQLLGMLVDAPPKGRIVDACAGAGGKTLQLAAELQNRGEVRALDIDSRRLDELRRRAKRAGAHNIRVTEIPREGEDAGEVLAPFQGWADRVLVDAPCSGTGALRRKPDARYRLTEEGLAEHVARQGALLDRFWPLVKPGGRLVYGTCSLLAEENAGVIEAFLARQPEAQTLPVGELLSKTLGEEIAREVTSGPYLELLPHRHGTDAFFGAVLVRR